MSGNVISFAGASITDVEEITHWYWEQGVPDVGDRIVAELIKRIEALRDHPDIGRIVPEIDQPALRELIHSPFRVVQGRESGLVWVVRGWRSERTPRTSE
jgi:plasmid stabilization system protein ParE